MNKDNAKLYLPLVQALADGKVLQMKTYSGIWADVRQDVALTFSNPASDYRIKPEPRKLYGVFNRAGDLIKSCVSMADATGTVNWLLAGGSLGPHTIVTFVEENQNV